MTANVLEHRRARAFADAVEDRPSTTEAPPQEGQFGELLAAVDILGSVPVPMLDPTVKMTQRAQLMAEFERVFAGGGGAMVPEQRGPVSHRAGDTVRRFRPTTGWGRRFALGGLAASVALGTFGGVAAASSSAVPGDTLYGMKRGLEDWQLNFAGSDAERGRLLLDQASRRMGEAQKLTTHQPAGQQLSPHMLDEVSRALTDMKTEGSQGRDLLKAVYQQDHSLAPMQQLAAFAEAQQQQLNAIEPRLGGRLDPVTGEVHELLAGIDADLAPLHLPNAQSGGGWGQPGSLPSPTAGAGATGAAGAAQGATTAPQGATTSGTGTLRGNGPAASPSQGQTAGGPVGGLGGLLGGSSAAPSANTTSGTGTAADPSASPTPATGQGVTIPPLLPGLLPGIGIGVSGS